MTTEIHWRGRFAALALATTLAACGGGGGGDAGGGGAPAPADGTVATVVSTSVPGLTGSQAAIDFVATNRGLYMRSYDDTQSRVLKLHGSPTFDNWSTASFDGFVANFAPVNRDSEAEDEVSFYWHTTGIGAKWGLYTANTGVPSSEMEDDLEIRNVAAGGRNGVITPRPWVIARGPVGSDASFSRLFQDDGGATASNQTSDRFGTAAPGSVDPDAVLLAHPDDPHLFVGSGDTLYVYSADAIESSVEMPASAGFAFFSDFIWHDGELWFSHGSKVYRRSAAGAVTEFAELENSGFGGAVPGRFCIQGGEVLMAGGTAKRISDGRERSWISSGQLTAQQQMDASLLAATVGQVYCSSASSGVYAPSADGKIIRMIFPVQAAGGGSGGGTGGDGDGDDDGGGTPAPSADKYVGTWAACWNHGDGTSSGETIAMTRQSSTVLAYTYTGTDFAGPDCVGAGAESYSGAGTATLVGTKTIGTETVDKVDLREDGVTAKQVFIVRAGRLYSGIPPDEPDSNADADGYPGALDTEPYEKQ